MYVNGGTQLLQRGQIPQVDVHRQLYAIHSNDITTGAAKHYTLAADRNATATHPTDSVHPSYQHHANGFITHIPHNISNSIKNDTNNERNYELPSATTVGTQITLQPPTNKHPVISVNNVISCTQTSNDTDSDSDYENINTSCIDFISYQRPEYHRVHENISVEMNNDINTKNVNTTQYNRNVAMSTNKHHHNGNDDGVTIPECNIAQTTRHTINSCPNITHIESDNITTIDEVTQDKTYCIKRKIIKLSTA